MELNFDKEIDAILRKARESEFAFVASNSPSHLDADEISAFAENALPELAKQHYIAHLADCDACRKKLSDLILLNAESEIENVHAEEIVPIFSAIPWYRQLFVFPNLAYTMGALVILFGGIIGFTVLQNLNPSQNSEVSQSTERPNDTKEKTSEGISVQPATNSTNIANMSFNSNIAVAASPTTENNAVSNKIASNLNAKQEQKKPTVLLSETPRDESPREDDASSLALLKDKKDAAVDREMAGSVPENKPETKKEVERSMSGSVDVVKSAPSPSKLKDLPVNGRSTDSISTSAKQRKNSQPAIETTTVSGKTFKRRENVWYDAAYNGQGTTNITRGTKEYKKLDKDLRVIVENLGGTVVVMWKEKAYQIQ